MPQNIRKGDLVMVISGDDRGKTGRVLRVIPKRRRVLVEGINVCRKHVRPNPKQTQGGVIEKEVPVAVSDVLPVAGGKPTRVRFQTRPDGAKVRVAARGGSTLGNALRKGRD